MWECVCVDVCAREWSGRACDCVCMCGGLCVGERAVQECVHVTESVSSAVGRPERSCKGWGA